MKVIQQPQLSQSAPQTAAPDSAKQRLQVVVAKTVGTALLLSGCNPFKDSYLPGDEAGIDPSAERLWAQNPSELATPPECSAQKLAEILAPPTADARRVKVDCQLNLKAGDVVEKSLILEGSKANNVTVHCEDGAVINGGAGSLNAGKDIIEIRAKVTTDSITGKQSYDPPQFVSVKYCHVIGSIRVWGMAKNANADVIRESSYEAGHTTRARNAAPRNVNLEGLDIEGTGRIPLYLGPGVTRARLHQSTIVGESRATAIYLDAESAENIIDGNVIRPNTSREQVAIDGSSYNVFVNNKLSALDNGGLELYRNCGEGGAIRFATPSHNTIASNDFYLDHSLKALLMNPTIAVGSRDGSERDWGNFGARRSYCPDDEGYDFGSSQSNYDHARFNQVHHNRFRKEGTITIGNATNHSNIIEDNPIVSEFSARLSACVVDTDGMGYSVLQSGEKATVQIDGQQATVTCDDGQILRRGK